MAEYFNGAAQERERRKREKERLDLRRQEALAREFSTKTVVPEDEAYVDRLPTKGEYERDAYNDLAREMARAALKEDKSQRG